MLKKEVDMQTRAFTLAEVLITLGVIGVVAALTIPVVMNYAFEREAVSKVKETYSLLSQAVEQWQMEGECLGDSANCPEVGPPEWPGGVYPHSVGAVAKAIGEHLKLVTDLSEPSAADLTASTWIPDVSTQFDGSVSSYVLRPTQDKATTECWYSVYQKLANGVTIKYMGIWWHYSVSMDINGAKPPNRVGKDQFPMSLYTPQRKSFNPYWYDTNSGQSWIYGVCAETPTNICNPDDGHSPTAYVLKYDKLPDMQALGFPSTP